MSLTAGDCPSGRFPSGPSPARAPRFAAPILAALALAACSGGGGDGLPLLGGGRTPETSGTPVAVHPGLSFLAIAPSYSHNCGIATDGRAWCWGKDQYGELGSDAAAATCVDSLHRCSAAPLPVQTSERFVAVDTWWGHGMSCALTGSGRAWCWGYGLDGQLGDGGRANRHTPSPVAGDVEFQVLRMSPTGNLACGLAKNGTPTCWGSASHGQLGLGESSGRLAVPTPVDWGRRFRTFDLGEMHACGLTEEGEAWCWGSNWSGQLGLGYAAQYGGALDVTKPTLVPGGQRFRNIAAGSNSTCALALDGMAWCWGTLSGTGVPSYSPARVAGTPAFTSIHAGFEHMCGLTAAGEAWCWGHSALSNASGIPAPVPTDVRFASLAHRPYCGLATDGKAWCWGNNDYHQLGY